MTDPYQSMPEKNKVDLSSELSFRTREANLKRMGQQTFDIAVIGGGITGAGVALDAASRGLSVALVEKGDFASGTSSSSSKLIHGGLRYLEQFHFGLVRESLHERAVLTRMAPHLSKPLRFLVPIYSSNERSPLGANKLTLSIGLWLYDLLAGSRNIERHRWLSTVEALRLAPALDSDELRGAFIYYDCLTNDARLVIEVIKSAATCGAVIANYAAVRAVNRSSGIASLTVEDCLTGDRFDLKSRVTVNATGVWSDQVSRLFDATVPKKLRPSKGIHVVLPREKFDNQTAVLIPSLGESRFLFVIPWQDRVVVGTTDTDYDGDLDHPIAEPDEVKRVIESASRAFPSAKLTSNDVISTFAGLRPLISANEQSTKELSRKEEIFEDGERMITITGGKLTTWRRMAERVVDRSVSKLQAIDGIRRPHWRRSVTENIQLAGGRLARPLDEEASRAANKCGVEPSTARHLIDTYGGNYRVVLELTREASGLKSVLLEGLPQIEAEVVYGARYEMAVTIEDFFTRRTRIGLLSRDGGRAAAACVAQLLGRELGWSESETQSKVVEYLWQALG
jgi:glycerol-3-phosphate dehydrogenase